MISVCIVQVKVKYEDGKDMITTYVMLDNCSHGFFIHSNLVKKIGVYGMKTTLNLKTVHMEKTESAMVVEDNRVVGMSCSLLILPKLYERREIPVDKEKVTT